MKAMQNDWYKKIEENLPDFFYQQLFRRCGRKAGGKIQTFRQGVYAAVASGKKIQYNGHRDSVGF